MKVIRYEETTGWTDQDTEDVYNGADEIVADVVNDETYDQPDDSNP